MIDNIVQSIAVVYLLIQATIVNVPNTRSALFFRLIPITLAVALAFRLYTEFTT